MGGGVSTLCAAEGGYTGCSCPIRQSEDPAIGLDGQEGKLLFSGFAELTIDN